MSRKTKPVQVGANWYQTTSMLCEGSNKCLSVCPADPLPGGPVPNV